MDYGEGELNREGAKGAKGSGEEEFLYFSSLFAPFAPSRFNY
jgi:hypothetical protein